MVKSLGRVPSKQFMIPTSANHSSLDGYLTNNFNTSNKNAKRNDSIKSSLFADNLMNTKPNQPQSNEDTYDGSDVQDDANANSDRDDLKRISSREIVSNPKSMIFSYTYNNIFNMVSLKCSCMKCIGDSIE